MHEEDLFFNCPHQMLLKPLEARLIIDCRIKLDIEKQIDKPKIDNPDPLLHFLGFVLF